MNPKNKNIYFILLFCFAIINFAGISSSNIVALPKTITETQTPKPKQKQKDTLSTKRTSPDTISSTKINTVQIDTVKQQVVIPPTQIDTVKKTDSVLTAPVTDNSLSNTKLFVYILLSLLGMGLFFFIFVMMMFKTFHKTRSTRQSLSLSWSLFFLVSVVWIFIIWGIVAGFSSVAAFTAVLIFLFIISLILTIISIKTR